MKIKLLLYCALGTPKTQLINDDGKFKLCWCLKADREKLKDSIVNGKIVAECECDVQKLFSLNTENVEKYINYYDMRFININELNKPLMIQSLIKYHTEKDINDVKCWKKDHQMCNGGYSPIRGEWIGCAKFRLTKAPRNMCWVWYKGQKCCLISFKPEDLCKILNGEKIIEVRRIINMNDIFSQK